MARYPSDDPSIGGTVGAPFDDGSGSLTVTTFFAVSADTSPTGVWWYSTVGGESVTPHLWADDGPTAGTQIATGPAVTCTAGWNLVPFTSPPTLLTSAGRSYQAGIRATAKRYSFRSLASQAYTCGPFYKGSGSHLGNFSYDSAAGVMPPSITDGAGTSSYMGIDVTDASGGTTKVTATQPISWAVRAQVAATCETRWAVRASVGNSVSIRWGVRARVIRAITLAWRVLSGSTPRRDITVTIAGPTGRNLTVTGPSGRDVTIGGPTS